MTSLLAAAQAKLDHKAARKQKIAPAARQRPSRGYDAADLLDMPMADPAYVARPYIAEGVTIFAGRPKVGKTTALRQLAFEANRGGTFFGARCERADVLFLSLEENERLMRKKLRSLSSDSKDLRGIRFEFEWEQGAAGVQLLREWLVSRGKSTRPPLIIIDSLTRFRVPPSDRGNAFMEDYNTVNILAQLCTEYPGLAVVVLHHTTKMVPDDPVSAISGTYGISAACGNYLIVLKQGQGFRLHAGGRLWEGDVSDFELRREEGGWVLGGEWTPSEPPERLTAKQQQIVEALRHGAKTNKTLAEVTGQSQSACSHALRPLVDKGRVVRIANGWGLAQ